MAIEESFTIQEIDSSSEHLETVKKLADTHSYTLGFLPYRAFDRLADKRCILVCISSEFRCVGYLLYNISRSKIKLTHLCVDKAWRSKGIAKALIQYIREKTEKHQHLNGIHASCRRDYNLDRMWSSLGFIAIDERPGKQKEGSILTEWWLDYGHRELLTMLYRQKIESSFPVAIDANIFYDLAEDEEIDEDSKESKALLSDWLEPALELCLTDEIKNEINRNKYFKKRDKLRKIANCFTFISCNQDKFKKARTEIREFFPEKMTDSDASDWHQLARVIGSDIQVSFFVTRDERLLNELEESIYKKFNLSIIRPIDFILRLDELRRESEYQPIRLAGTNIERQRVTSGQQNLIVEQFLFYSKSEKKTEFRRKVRTFLSDPEQYECFTVGRRNEDPIAFLVYDRRDKIELSVPVFRFKKDKLTPTILRHCLFQSFLTSASENRQFTRITETYLDDSTILAIQEDCFIKTENGWLRLNLAIADRAENLALSITNLCNQPGIGYEEYRPLVNELKNQGNIHKTNLMADIEKLLYPAKVTDADIPTFIVPIQAWYAKDLFDREFAMETLWGAQEELAFKREVVYYCSKYASSGLKSPGRILWYVSKSRTGKHSTSTLGAIRACSRIDDVIVNKPKKLYKQFRRLGVYDF